jgi:hypothetical protein
MIVAASPETGFDPVTTRSGDKSNNVERWPTDGKKTRQENRQIKIIKIEKKLKQKL